MVNRENSFHATRDKEQAESEQQPLHQQSDSLENHHDATEAQNHAPVD